MHTMQMYKFFSLLKLQRSLKYLPVTFNYININASNYIENKYNLLKSLSYEDSRLQKHLKFLKEEFQKASENNQSEVDRENYEPVRAVVSLTQDIENLNLEIKELDTLIEDLRKLDDELLDTAESEKRKLESKLNILKDKVLHFLIPDEIVDDKDIIIELSAGVGGQEAMLFTKDMFEFYCNYANWKGWNFEILKYDATDIGGIRNAHIAVSGHNAFKIMKYESGVHRVQRVPKTEKAGRIHTSTMTVAVLPQPTEIDIVITPNDIILEFKRSSGAGGQHVNTTDSCVRITHKATGIVVESQVERDQHKNRAIALKSLRAKLYERELEKIVKETKSSRKLQVGSAARSEKVRTYNFVQDRITDHRAHINIFDVETFFRGEDHFDNLLEQLQMWNCIQILNEILNKYSSPYVS